MDDRMKKQLDFSLEIDKEKSMELRRSRSISGSQKLV